MENTVQTSRMLHHLANGKQATVYAQRQSLDIPEHIYDTLMASVSGRNSTIDNSDITYEAIAAVAAIPPFTINRDLYKLIKSMDRNLRQCPQNEYNTDGRCITCFAKHHSECLIPQHYNTFSHRPCHT